MNKQPELTARTRQNLVDAFWSLYCTKRIEQITVKEITQRAGYNRATFYEYFDNVYDVLEQIKRSLTPTLETLPPISPDQSAVPTSLYPFVQLYVENRKYFTVLLGDHGDPSFQSSLKNGIKPMLIQVLSNQTNADRFEIDFTLEFVLSGMIGVLGHWFRQENPPPVERLVDLMYSLMQEGAAKRLGVG